MTIFRLHYISFNNCWRIFEMHLLLKPHNIPAFRCAFYSFEKPDIHILLLLELQSQSTLVRNISNNATIDQYNPLRCTRHGLVNPW